jgi:hypothetical protein
VVPQEDITTNTSNDDGNSTTTSSSVPPPPPAAAAPVLEEEEEEEESTADDPLSSILHSHPLKDIVNLNLYPLYLDPKEDTLPQQLDQHNNSVAITLPNFLLPNAIQRLVHESTINMHKAFYTSKDHTHNVYLTPIDPSLPLDHVYNRQVTSTKGCIQTDQIPSDSYLLTLYHNEDFKRFLQNMLNVQGLYPYEDPLSSINVHYASEGQELGWHFDNSAFAITLLLQEPEEECGGVFEYVPNVRDSSLLSSLSLSSNHLATNDAEKHHQAMGYSMVEKILNGEIVPNTLDIKPGTLVLFRGRDSLHRVTKVMGGNKTRIIVVLAYNEKPGVALSEEARRTFFGRTGIDGR